MKPIYIIYALFLFAGCSHFRQGVEISGTAKGMDGDMVSILDLAYKTLNTTKVEDGKFQLEKTTLDAGYYTFSIQQGNNPHDFEIYLEPGKYTIDVPQRDGDYLVVKTNSKIQNNLSSYYNFEDSVMARFRDTTKAWNARLNDPKNKALPAVEFEKIIKGYKGAQDRELGAEIVIMNMYIDKYPQNDIIAHIITNMDYQKNPVGYNVVFQRLSQASKNTSDGKKVGFRLDSLLKAER